MYKNLIMGWLFILAAGNIAVASTEAYSFHTAHVHGAAGLNIVLGGDTLLIELESPAINLIGFEHAPVNDEQKSMFHNVQQTLAATDQLFYFSAAICRPEHIEIEAPYKNEQHSDHEKHADFHANYTFKCERISDLKKITIELFTFFPDIHKINVQWILHGKQGTTVLTPHRNFLQIH